ncbi:MAG: flagellar biosynthetic protein FliO [Gemmatimonadota bacterium]|nr:flagellar biosynthetic protein FliO [Gemmatimonadota bacterium]
MSAQTFLLVMAMLALVLGAMGVAMRVLRKYALSNSAGRSRVKMEIIQRLSLGQRQGIAVVRIGGRILAVSMGDGGVHQVAELTETDLTQSEGAKGATVTPIHAIADGIRKLALIRGNDNAKTAVLQPASDGVGTTRVSYVAPIRDFQAVLSMAMAGGTRA